MSCATVYRSIEDFSYTLKRISLAPERRNNPNGLEVRSAYASNFLSLLSEEYRENTFFIDEVGFNVSMRSKRGRSLVGTPATQIVPTIGSRNISIYGSKGLTVKKRSINSFLKKNYP
jgi:hypothetical protein